MIRKGQVKSYWEASPCGSKDVRGAQEGSPEFFRQIERRRYALDRFMLDLVGFDRWKDKAVLEVGCGVGTDALQFARGGARYAGIDLTLRSARLAVRCLALHNVPGAAAVADAEALPFASDRFDLVYSWGVLHHTPDPAAAAREVVRVCRPGGQVMVMLYHRHSLVALQAWLYYGVLRGRPWRSPRRVIGERVESLGTRTYTLKEAVALFAGLVDVRARAVVSRFDLRVGRRLFLPAFLRNLVPSRLGWCLFLTGTKAKRG